MQSFLNTCNFLMSILASEPNHAPLIHRCTFKTSNQSRHVHFTNDNELRADVHYGGEVHRSWILGGLWNLISWEWHSFPGGGLHYGQESFGGELCTWLKKWRGCQRGDNFLKGSSPEVKFLEQPQNPGEETWPPKNSNLNKLVIPISFYSLVVLIG